MKKIASCVLMMAVFPAVADAGLLTEFSGNTYTTSTARGRITDGTLNFAVYEADPGGGFAGLPTTWRNMFGAGGDVVDAEGTYLYLYQVVNDGPSNAPIGRSNIQIGQDTPVSSFGFFPDSTFADSGGSVTSATFPQLPDGDVPGTRGSGKVTSGGSTDPLVVSAFGGVLGATYIQIPRINIGEGSVTSGERSSIFGFTTDVAPGWSDGSIISTRGIAASGAVAAPTHAPVPGAAVALVSLTPIGLGWYWRRKKNRTA